MEVDLFKGKDSLHDDIKQLEDKILKLEQDLFQRKQKQKTTSTSQEQLIDIQNEKQLVKMPYSLSSSTSWISVGISKFVTFSGWLEKKHQKVKQFVDKRKKNKKSGDKNRIKKKINKSLKKFKKQSLHSAETSLQMNYSPRKRFKQRFFVLNQFFQQPYFYSNRIQIF